MSLEWFSRMENVVRVSLPDVCEGSRDFEILFDTDTTEQHPSYIFSIDLGDEDDEFCIINFDPINQEFYSYHFDDEAELHAKVLFSNLDEMLSFIHTAFHEYLEEFDAEYVEQLTDDEEETLDDEDFINDVEQDDDNEDYDDYEEIEWISNDKYIHIEDNNPYDSMEHAISYKVGKMRDTGEGVLLRNTITRQNGGESEEKIMFFFREEEATYIVGLMNEYIADTTNV
ncbi:hypothetical protein PY093_02705 [Cytobacillus sp. S13-E01]|uniref:hypothetical protein n=1 Tax=Cytobacillus sp. S13-E01 TaxID=3031326 RepID=UPI0023D86671|nr:hypothetical protein [Cytobacillus sp. S13-E01]MDF0725623.1 hypothetical protein [Cytobacillus sp. S13-E01]